METAVVIAFPELSPVVDDWRERTSDDRPSMGVPPHVTLLYPFAPAETVGDAIDGLRELFATTTPFDVSFRELRRWPEMAYLAPDPPDPFAALTAAIFERWPDYPPYEGIHEVVIPHLTVAYGDASLLDEVETDVASKLPITTAVDEAVLLVEVVPDVRWETRARFPLQAAL